MYTLEEQNVLKEAFRIMDKAAGSGPVLTDPTMADARREEFVVQDDGALQEVTTAEARRALLKKAELVQSYLEAEK